jgi:cell division protein ZapC
MVQASKQWSWLACKKNNSLMLDMGNEMVFCTPYKLRQLTNDILKNPAFSLSDASFYQQVYAYLESFNLWNPAQICQICLNATAVKYYLKPILTKSWFFMPYTGKDPSVDAVICLASSEEKGHFLIVDHCEQASVCICLESNFKLDENFTLQQFEVIKVLNDRIMPLLSHQHQQRA